MKGSFVRVAAFIPEVGDPPAAAAAAAAAAEVLAIDYLLTKSRAANRWK